MTDEDIGVPTPSAGHPMPPPAVLCWAALHTGLAQLWPRLSVDRDARAAVLTGAGKAFSAGGGSHRTAAEHAVGKGRPHHLGLRHDRGIPVVPDR